MKIPEKKFVIKFSAIIIATIVVMTIFSIPLLGPPLGNLLFPGNGVWKVPGELPAAERLNIPGLKGEVRVIRDEWGVPHIYATYEEDLFFVQGYCHAQDRLFQMDMLRRQVKGQLSEIVGEEALPLDMFYLAIGMKDWAIKSDEVAREMYLNGTDDSYFILERYSDGINYYINTHRNELPLEYYLIGFEPTEWTPVDTFCLVQEMARQLSWSYDDLYRYMNFAAFGPDNYSELFNQLQPYQIPICPNYGDYGTIPMKAPSMTKVNPSLNAEISSFLETAEIIDSDLIEQKKDQAVGSNNWVVNGTKSSTGYPILCNDMHLSWILPGVWYEQQLVATESNFNCYGFAIPGMPMVAVGHNQYIGWGFTNTGYDVIDWYYYNAIDDTHYLYNNTVTPYTYMTYNINVKNSDPVKLTVRHTIHGPVLSDLRDFGLPSSLGNIVLAPKWIANGIYYNLQAGNGFDRATNREEFDDASKYWTTLAQNIVYADIYGNIAIRPTGKVPIRASGTGTFPYNGSNGEGEWIGYVPFGWLPNCTNPDQMYLVSSNQIVAGPNYTRYFLQNEYVNGYRARRINEVLSRAPDGTIDIEFMKQLQFDVNSTPARAFIPYLIEVIENYYGPSPPTKINNVLSVLKPWRYIMDKDSAAPTIYRKWRDYFMDYTFNDEINKYGAAVGPQLAMLEYLMKENETSHWFDDVYTPVLETRNETMLTALNASIDWLENFYGSNDPSEWRWGDLHQVLFEHLTGLAPLSKGPYEADGEGYCVNPSAVNIRTGTGYAVGGASERLIVDFSNLNNSLTVIPSGERGLSNSKHYADQLEELFLQGKYHYQYYTNTFSNFPTSCIESKMFFYPIGGV